MIQLLMGNDTVTVCLLHFKGERKRLLNALSPLPQRGGSGKLNRVDKWNLCLTAA